MIEIRIFQMPDGWYYQWSEQPKGADSWDQFEGRRDTLEAALEAVGGSIREKRPIGSLQGDELLHKQILGKVK